MSVSTFDIVALAAIGFFAFNGFRKGLIIEVFKILGVITGLLLAMQYMRAAAALLHSLFPLTQQVENVIGFILIFILTMVVFMTLARFVKYVFKVVLMGWLDRSGGILLGGIKGALIVSAFLPLLLFLPDTIAFVKDTREHSLAYRYLRGFAPRVYDTLGQVIPGSKSFTEKIMDSLPAAKSLGNLGSGQVDTQALNQAKQVLGTEESALLEEVQSQLKEFENLDVENLDLKDLGIKSGSEMLKDKNRPAPRKPGRSRTKP